MTPWDLIVWSFAVAAGLLIVSGSIALLAFLINMSRGKI